jgi:hypothetical protein
MNTTHNFPTFMPATAISPFVKFTRAPHTYVCYVGRSQTWPKGRILRGGAGGGVGGGSSKSGGGRGSKDKNPLLMQFC